MEKIEVTKYKVMEWLKYLKDNKFNESRKLGYIESKLEELLKQERVKDEYIRKS